MQHISPTGDGGLVMLLWQQPQRSCISQTEIHHTEHSSPLPLICKWGKESSDTNTPHRTQTPSYFKGCWHIGPLPGYATVDDPLSCISDKHSKWLKFISINNFLALWYLFLHAQEHWAFPRNPNWVFDFGAIDWGVIANQSGQPWANSKPGVPLRLSEFTRNVCVDLLIEITCNAMHYLTMILHTDSFTWEPQWIKFCWYTWFLYKHKVHLNF